MNKKDVCWKALSHKERKRLWGLIGGLRPPEEVCQYNGADIYRRNSGFWRLYYIRPSDGRVFVARCVPDSQIEQSMKQLLAEASSC